eukprot:scpid20187/ scgid7873/ 
MHCFLRRLQTVICYFLVVDSRNGSNKLTVLTFVPALSLPCKTNQRPYSMLSLALHSYSLDSLPTATVRNIRKVRAVILPFLAVSWCTQRRLGLENGRYRTDIMVMRTRRQYRSMLCQ